MGPRIIEWCQGNTYELAAASDGLDVAVVISHDCDLRSEKETNVEIIRSRYISTPNATFQYAKNARTLHIPVQNKTGDERWIELEQKHKQSVSIDELSAFQAGQWTITGASKRELKQWLAARYARPAFPDAFEAHLRTAIKKSTVEKELGKIIATAAAGIYAVFFQIMERDQELPDEEPYTLHIRIVYRTEDFHSARAICEGARDQIKLLFAKIFGEEGDAIKICLETCEAIADSEIRLDFIRTADQWRVEHLSFDDTPGEFLEAGKI